MKTISVITPCFNAEKYIEETILSVLNQSAIKSKKIKLEYIICDGNSTDKTAKVISQLMDSLDSDQAIRLISEPDTGMYEALAKGLSLATGDIITYINAGDFYNLSAFEVVDDVFSTADIHWVTGYTVCYNEKSQIIEMTLPYKFRGRLFECGYYGNGLPHVQQESTFWRSHLNKQIDFRTLASLRYAGDFYLWLQFSKVADLKVLRSYLGGFKFHGDHLSQVMVNNQNAYQVELQTLVSRPGLREKLTAAVDRLFWSAPYKLKKRMAPKTFISYNKAAQAWRLN